MSEAASKRGRLKREKILWAAAATFRERGYSATTLTEIATAAGTQAGSLYYHFDSRDDITREVLKCSKAVITTRVQEAWSMLPAGTPALERIRVGIREHVRTILSDDPFLGAWNRIINEVDPAIREEFVHYPRTYGRMWRDLLVEAQRCGDLRESIDTSTARLLLIGSITWSRLWFDPNGKRSADEIADLLIEIFFTGVLSAEGRRLNSQQRPPPPGFPGDVSG